MDAVSKGWTISGIAGIKKIEIDNQNDPGYVETTIVGDGFKLILDLEGLTDFLNGVQKATELAYKVHQANGYE